MEPTQPNPQQPNPQQQNQQAPNPDIALRSYFLQQGQSVSKLYAFLQSNLFAYGFKAFLSVLLQIACYLLFAFAIFIALYIPTDLRECVMTVTDSPLAKFTPNLKEITDMMIYLKLFIAVISLPILACALLLGRNRRKSARIRQAFNETDQMKNSFNSAMQQFRF